jgi:hypothetical protein
MREVIKLQAHYLESRILSIRMDKVAEFSSCGFIDSHGPRIEVQHSVTYVHTQNGLVGSIIKRIKLFARPLLMNCDYQLHVRVMQLYTLLTD